MCKLEKETGVNQQDSEIDRKTWAGGKGEGNRGDRGK